MGSYHISTLTAFVNIKRKKLDISIKAGFKEMATSQAAGDFFISYYTFGMPSEDIGSTQVL